MARRKRMTPQVKRLQRLYALRSQLADVAGVECRRIASAQNDAAHAAHSLREEGRTARDLTENTGTWAARIAASEIALRNLASVHARQEALQVQQDEARAIERASVLAREQTEAILDSRKQMVAAEQQRREQSALDEVHGMARLRQLRTTRI